MIYRKTPIKPLGAIESTRGAILYRNRRRHQSAAVKPFSFIGGSTLDFSFSQNRYWLRNQEQSRSDISAYHTRSSPALEKQQDNSRIERSVDVPRIVWGSGYHSEGANTGLVDCFNTFTAKDIENNAPTLSEHPGTHLGVFSDAMTVTSSGTTASTAGQLFGSVTNGDFVACRAVFQKSTSSSARILILGENATQSYFATVYTDDFSTAKILNNSWGTIHDEEFIDLGNDYFELRAIFEADKDYTGGRIMGGPHSATVGDAVHLIALDAKNQNAFTEFSDGAVGEDKMEVPATDHNISFNDGALFWKGSVYRKQIDPFPRMFSLGPNWNDGIQMYHSHNNGAVHLFVRKDGTSIVQRSTAANFEEDFTAGIAWRSDGTVRLKIGSTEVADRTGYAPLTVTPNLFVANNSGSDPLTGITERVTGFSSVLSDSDFDEVFAKVAAS